jgi:hypothetical protein
MSARETGITAGTGAQDAAPQGPTSLAMHLDDSELSGARWHGETLVLGFSAARVRWRDVDQGWREGFSSGVELQLHEADLFAGLNAGKEAEPGALLGGIVGRIREGELAVDGGRRVALTLPSTARGRVVLRLAVGQHGSLALHASGFALVRAADARLHESMAC